LVLHRVDEQLLDVPRRSPASVIVATRAFAAADNVASAVLLALALVVPDAEHAEGHEGRNGGGQRDTADQTFLGAQER
jgi:hypothetical protein